MKRRYKAGGELTKGRRRKAPEPKGRDAPKAVPRSKSSPPGEETEVARLTRKRDEALEQRTAISDILRVISNSPSDVQPVLRSVAEHAARICEAQIVDVTLIEKDRLRIAATFGQLERPPSVPLDRSTVSGRSVCDRQAVHVVDLQNAGDDFARGRELAIRHGHRTTLAVPLIREGRALGTIVILRTEVRPFEQKHIALLTTFADQAALAIENVRLFEAEQQRTRELTESLEQQTATSEVLQVISSSPGDLQLVFQAMLEKAVRICDAKFGSILRWDDEAAHLVATHNAPPAFAEARRRSQNPANPKTSFGRMIETKGVVHVADASAEPGYVEEHDPAAVAAVELGGQRTALYVPMLKETELVGALTLSRQEVRPFTDKQIDLVKNFAAQAVIAIENARLLNELRQRTTDLTETLEQQTAMTEVLRIISSSSDDLEPVFDAMLASAMRICDAQLGNTWLYDGDCFKVQANARGATNSRKGLA